MSPATLAETMTQGELAGAGVLPATRLVDEAVGEVAAYIRQALKNGWSNPALLPDEHRTVYLLLPDNVVVKGWMTRQFLGCVTWWTWDPRLARVSIFAPGIEPRILPRCVEPLAWCEITDPADQGSEA